MATQSELCLFPKKASAVPDSPEFRADTPLFPSLNLTADPPTRFFFIDRYDRYEKNDPPETKKTRPPGAQCPPQYLLPAFYLLDSICKNIGAPYIALFSRFIERAFLSAYHAVDPVTRTKLEELLGTWKTGGNDGGELFREPDEPREGARVQRGIEAALFGARGRGDGLGGRATKDAEMYHAGVSFSVSLTTPFFRRKRLTETLITVSYCAGAATPSHGHDDRTFRSLVRRPSSPHPPTRERSFDVGGDGSGGGPDQRVSDCRVEEIGALDPQYAVDDGAGHSD